MTNGSPRKQWVRDRFEEEPALWEALHDDPGSTVVAWEVHRRKELAKGVLRRRLGGRPARILEVGCGAGRNLAEIVRLDEGWRGVGVDFSSAMIDRCRTTHADEPRLRFQVLDVEERPLAEGRFDGVVMLGVVGYFESNRRAFEAVEAMLEPGGVLVFCFGRRPSLSRAVRRAAIRLRRGGKSAPDSGYRCFRRREILADLPSSLEVVATRNLRFTFGRMGPLAARLDPLLESWFGRRDPLCLASTVQIEALKAKAL